MDSVLWSRRLVQGIPLRILVPLALVTLLSAQVNIPADELRVHGSPYVPPPPPNTLRSQVNLVEVPVVVRDGKHRTIPGLTQDDFQVFDAGKKQAITAFSIETFQPKPDPSAKAPAQVPTTTALAAPAPAHRRFILLAFDNVSTGFADLRYTKLAAENFVRTGLAPGDQVAVVTTAFPHNAEFTADPAKLIESIEKLTPQPRFSDNNTQCPRITAYQAYLISHNMDDQTLQGVADELIACQRMQRAQAIQTVVALSHSIWEHSRSVSENTLWAIGAMIDGLSKLPGRRMILLSSSGFLSGDLEYVEDEMTARAVHAEVVINSLDSKGLYAITPGRPIDAPPTRGRSTRTQIAELSIQSRQEQAKDDGMAVLALGTGGAFYHNNNNLEKGFQELGSIPDLVYVLGFNPDELAHDGRYHALKVKLASGKHYSLQARLGYSAPSNTPPPESRKPSKLDTAVLSPETPSEVPVTMAFDGHTFVVHFDVGRLKFQTVAGRRTQKLTFLAALLDAKGNFFAGRQCEVELSLKQDTYDKLAAPGFNVTLPISAPPAVYTLRGIIEDDAGHLTAVNLGTGTMFPDFQPKLP